MKQNQYLNFDTVDLLITVNDFEVSETHFELKKNNNWFYELKQDFKPFGIGKLLVFSEFVDVDMKRIKVRVSYSAKIHKENYFDFNNYTNISEQCNYLKQIIPTLTEIDLLIALICAVDITENVIMPTEADKEKTFEIHKLIGSLNSDYHTDKRYKTSVIYTKQRIEKELQHRLIIYDKKAELTRFKHNKQTYEFVENNNDLEKILRVELNCKTKKQVKNLLEIKKEQLPICKINGVPILTYETVLKADKTQIKPLLKVYSDIMKFKEQQDKLFKDYDKDMIICFYETRFNSNWQAYEYYLKEVSSNRAQAARHIKKAKQIITEYLTEERPETKNDIEFIKSELSKPNETNFDETDTEI